MSKACFSSKENHFSKIISQIPHFSLESEMTKFQTIFCFLIPILLILDLADANVFTAINLHWTNESLRECKRECDYYYTPAYWTNTLPNWEVNFFKILFKFQFAKKENIFYFIVK